MSAAPPRLLRLVTLIGLGLLGLSCSSKSTAPAASSAPVRLFDGIAEAKLLTPSASTTARLFHKSFGKTELEEWRALPWHGIPVELEAKAPGAALQISGSTASLTLGPEPSTWLGTVEVPPATALVFEATISGRGLGTLGQAAKLGVIEFAARPTDAQLANFPAHMIGGHFGDPVQSDAGEARQLFFRTSPDTHFVVLLALLGVDGEANDLEPDPNLTAQFQDLGLRTATQTDRLARLFGSDATNPVATARLHDATIAMTHRRSLALAAGEMLHLPLTHSPKPGDQIDLSLGLVPSETDPLELPLDRALTLHVAVQPAASQGPPIAEVTETLRSQDATQSRWHNLKLQLPADMQLAGDAFELVITAASEQTAAESPLLLIGEPRLVPRALLPDAPARKARRPNVIVISIDTLRADRMSLFGNQRPTTPAIDAFAERCLVFEQAWSNGAYTLPSHMSLFTGQVPSLHGVQGADRRPDPGRSPLLAEAMQARGYTTRAFTGGGFVDPDFGFGRGFDAYGTADPMVNTESVRLAKDVQKIPGVDMQLLRDADISSVTDWLDEHRREELMLFLHTYVAHQFDPSEGAIEATGQAATLAGGLDAHTNALQLLFNMGEDGTAQDFEDLIGLYDASVRQADNGVGRFLAKLEQLDILEDSIVVIVSDHGKELGDHGKVGHGHILYEEMVHVPLLLFIGDRADVERGDFAPGRSAQPASLVDVLPTLFEALDIAPRSELSGMSLLHPLPDREVLAEVQNLAVKFAVRRGNHKTIWSPLGLDTFIKNDIERESYDLAADPLEENPLPTTDAELAHVRATFEAIEARAAELETTTAEGEVDEGLRARLEALGYVEDMRQTQD